MANGFAVAERRGVLTRADSAAGITTIEQLLSQVIESSGDFIPLRHLISTAGDFQLSAYAAVYLETARRERLPLASLDRRLLAAAEQAGLELFS
jgi:predicted nucleic acid-binding protein